MLWNYVACSNTAILEVRDLNESITMSTLKQGFQNGHLSFSLDKTIPKSYVELLAYARKYVQARKGITFTKKK